jgi:hypothetical protein
MEATITLVYTDPENPNENYKIYLDEDFWSLGSTNYLANALGLAWAEVGVTEELCDPPVVNIDSPQEGWMVRGSEVIIRGYATDIGSISHKINVAVVGGKDILYKIKAAGDDDFTSFCADDCLSMKGFDFERTEICLANEPDTVPDECSHDSDSVYLIDTDPECPNVGFLATFDSSKYDDGDYVIRVIARDYQGNESSFDRAITIDNYFFSDDFESGDTSAWSSTAQ